jgi:hypothetical protein
MPDDGYNALPAAFTMISARYDGKPRTQTRVLPHVMHVNVRASAYLNITRHSSPVMTQVCHTFGFPLQKIAFRMPFHVPRSLSRYRVQY